MQRRLSGRVARADDEHVLVLHRAALAHGRAVEDARAHERLEPRYAEPPPLDSGRDHDGARAQLGPVEQMNDSIVAALFERDRLLRKDDVRSHQPRLLAGSLHEKAAVDAVGKPGIVPDQRARAGLPAGDRLVRA